MGFEFDMDHDFLRRLNSLEKPSTIENITKKCLEGGSELVKKEWDSEMGKHVLTGSLANSVKASKVQKDKNGTPNIFVFPTGKDKRGIRNAEKAMYLEYGTYKQPAKPFLQNITDRAEKPVLDKMQEIFEKEIEGLSK